MTFLMWILAGVLAGLLAGWVRKRGGYGLNWDITLGLVGSIGGAGFFDPWGSTRVPGSSRRLSSRSSWQ